MKYSSKKNNIRICYIHRDIKIEYPNDRSECTKTKYSMKYIFKEKFQQIEQ